MVEILNSSKVGSIARGVKARCYGKRRPVQTPFTTGNVRKKGKSEL